MSNNPVMLYSSDIAQTQAFYLRYFDIYDCQTGGKDKKEKPYTKLFFVNDLILEVHGLPDDSSDRSVESSISKPSRLAIKVRTIFQVMNLTYQLIEDGYSVLREPHATDKGHYYSLVLDPDGNQVEIFVNVCS